jgi:hypothetical protein
MRSVAVVRWESGVPQTEPLGFDLKTKWPGDQSSNWASISGSFRLQCPPPPPHQAHPVSVRLPTLCGDTGPGRHHKIPDGALRCIRINTDPILVRSGTPSVSIRVYRRARTLAPSACRPSAKGALFAPLARARFPEAESGRDRKGGGRKGEGEKGEGKKEEGVEVGELRVRLRAEGKEGGRESK